MSNSYLYRWCFSRRIADDLRSPTNGIQINSTNPRSPELQRKATRQDSISSDMSVLTTDSDGNLENEWVVWNKIINNWPMYMKRKAQWIRVGQ